MYDISDQTTHSKILSTRPLAGPIFWGIPKYGTTYKVQDGYLYIMSRGMEMLVIPRSEINTPVSTDDITLATALEFLIVPPASGGGGVYTGSNGVNLVGTDFQLGSPLTAPVKIDPATFGLSIETSIPDSLAILDLQSTDKGFLIPRMTDTQRQNLNGGTGVDALMLYQTDANSGIYYWSDAYGDYKRLISNNEVNVLLDSRLLLKGDIAAAGNPNYPSAITGDVYRISDAGGIMGGASGKVVALNDLIIARANVASGNEATVGIYWIVVKGNLISATNADALAKTDTAKMLTPSTMVGFLSINVGLDCSTNPNYPSGKIGDITRVTVAGKIGGASGITVAVNDLAICLVANAGGTQAAVGANWTIQKNNGNTNWRGVSATNPLVPIAGDWYTNSANGVNYYYDATNAVWNTNGIIRVTQSQRIGIASPPTGMQVYQTDLLKGMYEYDGTTWVHRSMSVTGTTAQRPASPVTGQVYFDTTRAKILQWNGAFWQGLKIDTEEYISIGERLQFVTSTAAGGAAAVDTINVVKVADLGGVTLKARSGMSRMNITAASNSRVQSGFASSINGVVVTLAPSSYFYYAWELDVLNTAGAGVVDFANDPVLMGWGLFDTFSSSIPLNGVFMRPPRLGETAFIKYVVRTAGVDATLSTTIPYTNTSVGFFKVGLLWDGASDTLTFIVQANGVNSIHPITNFLATNPLLAIDFCPVLALARNGNPIVGVARQFRIDKAHRHIGGNYPDTI